MGFDGLVGDCGRSAARAPEQNEHTPSQPEPSLHDSPTRWIAYRMRRALAIQSPPLSPLRLPRLPRLRVYTRGPMPRHRFWPLFVIFSLAACGGRSVLDDGATQGTAGAPLGGWISTGAWHSTGGAIATGGMHSVGGVPFAGAMPAIGGNGIGGAIVLTGGTKGTGGKPGFGGAIVPTGGAMPTGGMYPTGGNRTLGGAGGLGGTFSAGGSIATGGGCCLDLVPCKPGETMVATCPSGSSTGSYCYRLTQCCGVSYCVGSLIGSGGAGGAAGFSSIGGTSAIGGSFAGGT